MNTRPPSVSRIETATHSQTGDVPLPGTPSYAVLSQDGATLYVLLNGAFDLAGKAQDAASSLVIVDVRAMRLVSTIELGWRTHKIAMTEDGRYIVARSAGRSSNKKSDEIPPVITIVSTATNQVAAKWECPRKDVRFRASAENVDVNNALAFSKDLSSVFDYSDGLTGDKEPAVPASLTVFSLGREAPVRQITFPFAGTTFRFYDKDHRSFVALSPDGRWLYVVETGNVAVRPKNRRNGKVHVVDVAAGKLANSHDLGYGPLKPVADPVSNSVLLASEGSLGEGSGRLYRFTGSKAPQEWEIGGTPLYIQRAEALRGYLVATSDEIRILQDSGELAPTPIRLRNRKERGVPKVDTELKNSPGRDFVALPAIGRLVLSTYGFDGGDFYPEDDLAIIDLQGGRIERNMTVGRGSVKFGKGLLAFSLTMATAMASGYAAYSIGSPVYAYPIFGVRGTGDTSGTMVAGPNQARIWVLNPKTNDVTEIDPVKMTDVRKLAVGTGCSHMMSIPSLSMACVICDDELALLDLKEETIAYKRQFSGAKLLDVGWDERLQEIVALTSGGLVALNAVDAKVKAEITGLHDPMLLIQSR